MPDQPKTLLDGFGEATEEVVRLRAEIEDLTRLSQSYLAECSEERVKAAKAEAVLRLARAEVKQLQNSVLVPRGLLHDLAALLDQGIR